MTGWRTELRSYWGYCSDSECVVYDSMSVCGTMITLVRTSVSISAIMALLAMAAAGPPPCSLNGVLDAKGACVCDPPWSGPQCETMGFRPVRFPQGYGMHPNKTTWGGNILTDPNGQFHLFVSAMTNGCGLGDWSSNSRIGKQRIRPRLKYSPRFSVLLPLTSRTLDRVHL